jgi:anti-anti-sigma factor
VLQDRSRPYVAVAAFPDEGIVTITLRGELDSTARAALSEHLTKHFTEYSAQAEGIKPRQLVIDMADVDFLDWAAAAVIFAAARLMLPAGVKPIMRSPKRPVRRLLAITGLDQQCELGPGHRSSTPRVIIPLPRKAPHIDSLRHDYGAEVTSPRRSLLLTCGGQCRAPRTRQHRSSAPVQPAARTRPR